MSCKYSDGTEMKVGDLVKYDTLDMESYSRGYGVRYETKTSKIKEFKVILENGDDERVSKITKVTSGGKRRKTRKNTRKY